MRLISPSILLLPTLILASSSIDNSEPTALSIQTLLPQQPQLQAQPSSLQREDHPSLSAESTSSPTSPQRLSPSPFPSQTQSPSASSSPPSTPHLNNLELRQGVAPNAPAVPVATAATQQSPITTYMVHGADGQYIPMPYTQTFGGVPDQWPSPTPGTIGLGTIQGQIGVVKTKAKRDVDGPPQPTGVVQHIKRKVFGRGAEEDSVVLVERERGKDGKIKNVRVVKREVNMAVSTRGAISWALGSVVVGLGVVVPML